MEKWLGRGRGGGGELEAVKGIFFTETIAIHECMYKPSRPQNRMSMKQKKAYCFIQPLHWYYILCMYICNIILLL